MIINEYFDYLQEAFDKLKNEEVENIDKAAKLVADSIEKGGKLYVFGSGHSHMIAEEIYIRAGGLALINPILPGELMLHQMPNKSTYLERLEGYAEAMLELHKLDKKDSILIISNSGRNNVPVEMALKSKEKGANVIVITSLEHTMTGESRHKSGKRMCDFADVTIDNKAPIGDAAFKVPGVENPTGPLSDFIGIAIANTLIVSLVEKLNKMGIETPIFKSSNMDGADEYNNDLFDKYYGYRKWK